MIAPSMKPAAERLLRLIVERASRAKDLVRTGLSQATVFRHVSSLLAEGFVTVDDNGVYRASRKGREWIDARTLDLEVAPELPIPALSKAPSPVHRAILELGACAAAARVHRTADRSLAGFVLLGPSGTFKSTTACAMVAMAGGDVREDVVDAASEAGRGLLVRRNARGEEVTRCRLLKVPVAVFDETDKLQDARAKSILENVYFMGTATANNEGTVFDVTCTPVATLNPVDEEGSTFAELTGFHCSRERRVVLVQLPKVSIPPERLDEDWLAELVSADRDRAVKLPPPRSPALKAAGRFREIIDLVIEDPKRAQDVDPHVLNVMARGATAWLDDERAIRLVSFAWARLMVTNGYCHPDWELRLQLHFAPAAVRKARRARRRARRMKKLEDAVKKHLGGDLAHALKVIRREGVVRTEAPELVTGMEAIARTVVSDFEGDARRVVSVLERDVALRRRGLSIDNAVVLVQSANDARLSVEEAARLIRIGADLLRLARSPQEALALARQADVFEITTDDACYSMKLGLELLDRGFRLKDLPTFDRTFGVRR
jgi:hypothetical protein